jgi:hypothetical protein
LQAVPFFRVFRILKTAGAVNLIREAVLKRGEQK